MFVKSAKNNEVGSSLERMSFNKIRHVFIILFADYYVIHATMYAIISALYSISLTGWLTAAVMTLLIAVAIDWKCRNAKPQKYNLPPGPKGIPLLGTFPAFLKAPAHVVFDGEFILLHPSSSYAGRCTCRLHCVSAHTQFASLQLDWATTTG